MEMTGGTLAVIDRTVDYVKNRYQFNRPIASFQAAQHHVANMHIASDGGRLTAYQAVWLTGRGHPASASRHRQAQGQRGLQIRDSYRAPAARWHGILRETDLHLWSQRAKSTELLGGGWDAQLAAIERACCRSRPRHERRGR